MGQAANPLSFSAQYSNTSNITEKNKDKTYLNTITTYIGIRGPEKSAFIVGGSKSFAMIGNHYLEDPDTKAQSIFLLGENLYHHSFKAFETSKDSLSFNVKLIHIDDAYIINQSNNNLLTMVIAWRTQFQTWNFRSSVSVTRLTPQYSYHPYTGNPEDLYYQVFSNQFSFSLNRILSLNAAFDTNRIIDVEGNAKLSTGNSLGIEMSYKMLNLSINYINNSYLYDQKRHPFVVDQFNKYVELRLELSL